MKQRTKLTRFYLDSAQRLSLCLQQDQLVLLINYRNQRNADLIKYVFKKFLISYMCLKPFQRMVSNKDILLSCGVNYPRKRFVIYLLEF